MQNRIEKVLEFDKVKQELSNYAFSEMVRIKILELKPSSDIDVVKRRQRETREGVSILRAAIELPIHGIRDIRNSLYRAKIGSTLTCKELLDIASTMRASRLTKDVWRENKLHGCDIIDHIISELHTYKSLEDKIQKSILAEDKIADNASPKLQIIRRRKRGLVEGIRLKLESIIKSTSYQRVLQEPIVTMRKGRYVLPVKQGYRGSIPGVVHDQSTRGATLFIEPMSVLEKNNELNQLESEEKREIEEILKSFTKKISENRLFLSNTLSKLVQLDLIQAKANYSLDINGVEPLLNTKGFIDIKKARHPLLKGEVVPIDVTLGNKFSILVITGPNTGGKTVSLKTVGLLTLMSQSGLRIPADEGSEVAIFGDIFADIGDEQSIEQNLSTFSSHMKNIIGITKLASKDSLILLDELGAGTDPTEGAALAMAILSFFYQKGSKVIATTHYSELKNFAYSAEGIENASVEFDVNTLRPTYKLTIGIPGKSNALEITKRLGLKQEIIDTARQFISGETLKMEDMLGHIEREKAKIDDKVRMLNRLKTQYEEKLELLEQEKRKNIEKRKEILNEAKNKARNLLEDVQIEAERTISKLKEIEIRDDKVAKEKAVQNAREWLKKKNSELSKDDKLVTKRRKIKVKEPLKPGEKVYISNLGKEGYIQEIDSDESQALVQIGILKVNVPIDELEKVEDELQNDNSKKSSFTPVYVKRTRDISTEIDLRGFTLDDALLKVDRYLDEAFLSGLPYVNIIHGKGTGTLRQGIQQMLRTRKNVTFRDGRIEEGGLGVTVVKFK